MSREGVLGKIREAESTRREMEASAAKEKESIIQQARLEARRILEKAAADAEASATELLRTEAEEVQKERRALVLAGQKEVLRQKERSATRLPAAVEKVYSEFLRQINAPTP